MLLKFLYDHTALSQDLQARVRWRPGTVVVWDVSKSPRGCHSDVLIVCRTVSLRIPRLLIGKMASVDTLRASHLKQRDRTRHLLKVK